MRVIILLFLVLFHQSFMGSRCAYASLTSHQKQERLSFIEDQITRQYQVMDELQESHEVWNSAFNTMRVGHRLALGSAAVSALASVMISATVGSATLINGQAIRFFAGRVYGGTFALTTNSSAVLLGTETVVQVTQLMKVTTFLTLLNGLRDSAATLYFIYDFMELNKNLYPNWINNLSRDQYQQLEALLSVSSHSFITDSQFSGSSEQLFHPSLKQMTDELEDWFSEQMRDISSAGIWSHLSLIDEFFTRSYYKESALRTHYYQVGIEIQKMRLLNLFYLRSLLE